MIKICEDEKPIFEIMNHPKIFDMSSDDLSQKPFIPDMSHAIYLINEEETGMASVVPISGVLCQVHVAVLPELWGGAVDFFKEAFKFGFEHTCFQKVMALVPEYNRLTIRIAGKVGMVQEGKLTKSFLKNWELHDQIIFGLNKIDFLAGGK